MKRNIKIIAAAAAALLLLTPFAVNALMVHSEKRTNRFRPAEQNVQIAENSGQFADTQSPSGLTWTKNGSTYTAKKEVQIKESANPNGEYLRVRIVPAWYNDAVFWAGKSADAYYFSSMALSGDKLLCKNSDTTVITMNLKSGWNSKWTYKGDGVFESIAPVKSGDSADLLESVEISDTVYNAAETAGIHLVINVLADSVQVLESGTSGTNPRWP